MLSAKSILKRVFGEDPVEDCPPNGAFSEVASTSSDASGLVGQQTHSTSDILAARLFEAPAQDQRLSRFAARHHRAKPKAPAPFAYENAEIIAQQISNDGVDAIPLSVLQNALPDRVSMRGGLDAIGAMMEAPRPWAPRD